jgi:hypothetical protein
MGWRIGGRFMPARRRCWKPDRGRDHFPDVREMVAMSHFSASEDVAFWDIGFNGRGTKLTRGMIGWRLTY